MCMKRCMLLATSIFWVSEYYNQNPVEVLYRGNSDKLYERDFAGEIMDMYPDLLLIDMALYYRRIMISLFCVI